MNKEAKELKRLIQALDSDTKADDLADARKPAKDLFELLNGYDVQSELETLENTLALAGYDRGPIADGFNTVKQHLEDATRSLLELTHVIEEEVKNLRAEEKGEMPLEDESSRFPAEEVIDEDMKEDIISEIMKEDEEQTEKKKEKEKEK